MVLLLFASTLLSHAQEIAVHPLFAGNGQTTGMLSIYYTALLRAIPNMDGSYTAFAINLDDDVRPGDVPAGGFPPWICPAPSITGRAEYALTGEVVEDRDYPGYYRLRLYFWKLEGTQLLVSDEITAADRNEAEAALPFLLEWLFSAIVRDVSLSSNNYFPTNTSSSVGSISSSGAGSDQGLFESLFRHDNWLYLGLRLGGGSSGWYYNENKAGGVLRTPVTHFYNANAAFQVVGQVLPFLAFQLEAQLSSDLNSTGKLISEASGGGGLFSMWAMHIPFMVKFTINHNNIKAGLFGGVYYYLPLFKTGEDHLKEYFNYKPDQPGFVFGLSFGYKIGPGHLFIDSRFEYDGHWRTDEKTDAINSRRLIKIGIGYEIGLFKR